MSDLTSSMKMPKTVEAIHQIFVETGIKEYEPQLLVQMTDLAHAVTSQLLDEAKALSDFAGKKQIDEGDVQCAIKEFKEKYKPNKPSQSFLMELATQKNSQPLAPIRQNFGLRLPNDRFCQVQPNFKFDDSYMYNQIAENGVNYQENESYTYNNFETANNLKLNNVSNLLLEESRNENAVPVDEDFD